MKSTSTRLIQSCGLITTLILLSGCKPGYTAKHQRTDKPNIILILADDAGYADFGFMGSQDIQTPNLDLLASDGTVFTDAHVTASVCSPSRAGLLTGTYQQRFGHECNLEPNQLGAFDTSQVTIAEYLSTKGYHTSIFGKWHLGEALHQHPLSNGFDYFWGFLAGGRSYFPNENQDRIGNSRAILENHSPTQFEGYLTDAIGDQAASYIDVHSKDVNPFFMYISFNAPHTPMHAKKEVLEKFDGNHERPVYAAMMWSMDEAIGKVISRLKANDIYDNTLIFFLSDNGGAHNNGSSVRPFKGWKGNQYEGGTRVPFITTWKKKLPSGKKIDGLTSSLDVYATVASILDNKASAELEGVDLIPYITGKKNSSPHEELYWRKDEMATIRMGNFKYITLFDSISVLYDLEKDQLEIHNLITENGELADSLKIALDHWQDQLISPLWIEPHRWNLVTRRIYQDLMHNNEPTIKEPSDLKREDLGQKERF